MSFGDKVSRLMPNENALLRLPETSTEEDGQRAVVLLGQLIPENPIRMLVQDMDKLMGSS